MEYSVIVLCAGSGTRTGLKYNKIFHRIDGITVYQKTMSIFLEDIHCKQIIVVTKEQEIEDLKEIIVNEKITYSYGGKERQDSVYNGLQLVNQEYVLIHDGARPYLQRQNIEDILAALQQEDACLLMVPCKDTIKEVKNGVVQKTLPRETLMQAQTPQAFKTKIIKEAYQKGKDTHFVATDDCSLVEAFMDCKIRVVMGSYDNIKITTKEDL